MYGATSTGYVCEYIDVHGSQPDESAKMSSLWRKRVNESGLMQCDNKLQLGEGHDPVPPPLLASV
ncbi:hypothetical protein N7465_007816 [Penicillium sp. CMV-2018d]|nr:hypothetical protein N7465_007816 [Penicillium sp. CMV-2018d]